MSENKEHIEDSPSELVEVKPDKEVQPLPKGKVINTLANSEIEFEIIDFTKEKNPAEQFFQPVSVNEYLKQSGATVEFESSHFAWVTYPIYEEGPDGEKQMVGKMSCAAIMGFVKNQRGEKTAAFLRISNSLRKALIREGIIASTRPKPLRALLRIKLLSTPMNSLWQYSIDIIEEYE